MGRECVIDSSVTLHELRVLLTTKILHKPFNYFNVFFLIYFINQYFIYTFIYFYIFTSTRNIKKIQFKYKYRELETVRVLISVYAIFR